MLLHPLRLQLMELAIEETSGTEAARRLGLPRQMVNYHVTALEKAGFLVPAGLIRRRNMVERRLRTSARSYLISPDILGRLSGARRRGTSPASPTALLALAARLQSDLGASLSSVPGPATPPTLSFSSKIHFADDAARRDFVRELGEAVGAVVREYSAPVKPDQPAPRFALILGFYPLPHSTSQSSEGDH